MTPIWFSLDEHIALVTGARSGIGRAVAIGAAAAGRAIASLNLTRDGIAETVKTNTSAEGRVLWGQSSTAAFSKCTSLAPCARVVAQALEAKEAPDA